MNSSLVFFAFLAFALIGSSLGQVYVPASCDYPVQQNFNLTRYLGKWYEIESTNFFDEAGGTCVEANYAQFPNATVEVLNRMFLNESGMWASMLGNARPANGGSTEAKFFVSFPSVGAYDSPYWVIESDYTSYSLVLSCRPVGNGSIQTMWFLARDKNPTITVRDIVHAKISELDLDDYLTMDPTDHNNCPEENSN